MVTVELLKTTVSDANSVSEYLFTIAAVLLCYGLRTHFSFLS